MHESSRRRLAYSSIGFSPWQAERTGPISLEDKETKVPRSNVTRPGQWIQQPPLSAPALRGRLREVPPEDVPSGPQEGISSKSASLARNPQFQVAKLCFLPSPMEKAGDGKATVYVSSPLAGCLLGQSLVSLWSGVRMRPPTGLAEDPGCTPRHHPSPIYKRSPWKVLPVLLTASINKSSAAWVAPPQGTNRLTLSTPPVLEGPSMQ